MKLKMTLIQDNGREDVVSIEFIDPEKTNEPMRLKTLLKMWKQLWLRRNERETIDMRDFDDDRKTGLADEDMRQAQADHAFSQHFLRH